ncbi:uncharacterized protein V6R79_018342 [Siganus canaliculatus]
MTSTPEPADQQRLQAFVSLLTIKVLAQLGVTKTCSLAEWVVLTSPLSRSVMDGLSVTEGFCPDVKSVKKQCKVITEHVQQQLGTKNKMDAVTVQQNSAVGLLVVEAIRSHIEDLSDQQARERAGGPRRWWSRFLPRKANKTVVLGLIAAVHHHSGSSRVVRVVGTLTPHPSDRSAANMPAQLLYVLFTV